MGAIQKIIRGGVALALGALLAVSAAPAAARAEAVGAFEVTGGTQGEGYSYADGVLTVNDGADIALSMVGGRRSRPLTALWLRQTPPPPSR